MKRIPSFFFSGTLIFTLCATLLTGCQSHVASSSVDSLSQTETSDFTLQNAKFMKDATPVEGQTGLYEVRPEIFSGKEYGYLFSFGSNLLLVSESYDQNVEYDYEVSPHFCFDVYNPSTNQIVYSLNTDDLDFTCSYYQILDQQLVLFDYENYGFYFYNKKLQLENSIDLSPEDSFIYFNLYPSGKENLYYLNADYDKGVYALEFSKGSYTLTPLELEAYANSIQGSTPDGKFLLTYSLDRETLKSQLCIIDPKTLEEIIYIGNDFYYTGSIMKKKYLFLTDIEKNIWRYGNFDETYNYLQLPSNTFALLYDDNTIVIQDDPILSTDNVPSGDTLLYKRYNASGYCLNAFSYSYKEYITTPVYQKNFQCMFFLVTETGNDPYLLVWDLSISPGDNSTLTFYDDLEAAVAEYYANPPLSADSEIDSNLNGNDVTAIPDISSYDWGDLEEANNKATTLENIYGIEIYLGPEVPELISGYHLAPYLDPVEVEYSLDILEGILSIYPADFISQLIYGENQGIRVYLSGAITSDEEGSLSEAGAFVTDLNSYKVMVLDVNQTFDWSYSVNHEISHMIDKRLELLSIYVSDTLFSETEWDTYNPDGFCYLYTYDGYEDSDLYQQYPEYFVGSYGVTFPTEDRAMLFGASMSNHLDGVGYEYILNDPENIALQNKFSYYCQCIRDGFDTTGWPEVTPWEQILIN